MIKAKKRLGQNFLTSKSIVSLIVKSAEVNQKDTVLEVGPGKGVLTEELLKYAGRVIAIEKDKELINFLKDKFKKEIINKKLELIYGDALDFDPKPYILKDKSYKIVANIPYYITSRLLKTFLETRVQPEKIVLLVQKEVSDRITTKEHKGQRKESILSISVKVYGTPKFIKKVPAMFFNPKPKVDSAIILISDISKKNFTSPQETIDEKKFFEIVKKGFSSKRKLLKNNLNLINTACLLKCGIPIDARAERLSVDNWLCLLKNPDCTGL
ncbi:MAG: 16S rRNA (adenine(1518)-N(6)/adenine(1519)-N(6))-dimethyltransferase RsmA [Parcubacteria group bacterium]|nr:16S rRNA (adenine(1518)-N(6)/adenine(1519)-N(6))-dimethyltransferase RsmA [Parcubacteria group bacterium]MCR4342807.1 16S rRNA (adenine(1518)-N(6)/adenine(1519)-N(6))-dimethyltransferase RsmA [Patescibacteria group bacterium]